MNDYKKNRLKVTAFCFWTGVLPSLCNGSLPSFSSIINVQGLEEAAARNDAEDEETAALEAIIKDGEDLKKAEDKKRDLRRVAEDLKKATRKREEEEQRALEWKESERKIRLSVRHYTKQQEDRRARESYEGGKKDIKNGLLVLTFAHVTMALSCYMADPCTPRHTMHDGLYILVSAASVGLMAAGTVACDKAHKVLCGPKNN
jgi:hypothetical protein